MPTRHLIPVPVPRGRSGTTGFLSVYFVPRLLDSGTLADYNDWKVWPDVANALTFTVRINGTVRPATKVSAAASLAKWQAVFANSTPVTGYRFVNRSLTPPLVTYRQSELLTRIEALYAGTMATSPTAPPSGTALLASPATASFLDGSSGHIPEAAAFVAPVVDPPAPPIEPEIDVHAAYSLLGAHPQLLRMLGMVVDLEVTLPAAAPSSVRVTTNYTALPGYGANRFEIPFQTRTSSQFWPQGNTNVLFKEQTSGWMDLASNWSLTATNDLVTASRLENVARNIDNGDPSGALPAREEGGISLLRTNNAAAIRNRWARQAVIEQHIAGVLAGTRTFVEVWAEDLTVGQRVDVRDLANNTWRSLFQRQADEYAFPRDNTQDVVPAPDEGWTTFVLASEQAETYVTLPEGTRVPTARQRVRDTYFTWNGWSAAAPPPSNVIDADGNVVPIETSASAGNAKVKMNARYAVVPGTLPRLRYGRSYQMRARAVFLDGSSRSLADVGTATSATGALIYGRQAPVSAPDVVRRADKPIPGVGEAVDTVVLLGDYDTPDGAVTAQERVFFPARSSQARCELHGLPNGGVDPALATYNDLVLRDGASVNSQCVTDPVSGELVADPALGSNPLIGYLPEPAANAVAFDGLPGSAGPVLASLLGTWPSVRAARLVVEAGSTAPSVATTSGGRTVRVRVPKASDVTVAVSTGLAPSYLPHFALWNSLSAVQQASLTEAAKNGLLWMLSPARSVRLVHAVRRPMLPPGVSTMTGTRPAIGSDQYVFDATFALDRNSTDQLVARASFTDPVDDPAAPAPATEDRSVVLGQFVIDVAGAATSEPVADVVAVMHDQKRHDLEVEVEATSRFARYFTQEALVVANQNIVLAAAGVAEGSVELADPATGVPFERDKDFTVNAATGTARRLAGGAIPPGATVRARFVARPVSRLSTEGGAAAFALTVPASVAPAPLEVREVVPATTFTETSGVGFVQRVRTGTIVRIWSERGWFSSGPGELLGVAIDRSGAALPQYTRLGRDPITTGDASPNPVLTDFPRAAVTATNVDGAFDVAAHAITYDTARGLWFTDVEVAGSVDYRPFLRLSVVRYQPEAIDFAHLSPVRNLEPIRLMANRTTRVTRNLNGTYTIRVEGIEHEGIPNEAAGNVAMFNTVVAEFQVPTPGIADPDLRWQRVGAPIVLTRTKLASGVTRWEATVARPATLVGLGRIAITESEPMIERVGETGRRATGNEVAIETLELSSLL